jgi:BirA family biotin operon repressor/biotin-[acetyl-CoA-carboxylase] ligase
MTDELPSEFTRALTATIAERGAFGARLHYFVETGSTNDLAAAAAERGAPEGTTFVAGAQTAGRGRRGRSWFSPPGAGLYISTIVRRASIAPWLTLAGGVAVAEAVRTATGLPVQIKWPNDIVSVSGTGFRARRKIAGILAEAASAADGVQYVTLGIGINVGAASFPPELADRAGSIETELGRPADAGPLLAQVLVALNRVLGEVEHAGPPNLFTRWLELAPSASGERIEWDGAQGVQRGISAGLAEDGALLARTPEGLTRIVAGEVRWL